MTVGSRCACMKMCVSIDVVVVLPSLPVTPMIVHGQTSKKISISDVTMLPRAFASSSAGTSGRRPGVRKNDVRAQIIEVAFAKLQVRAQRFQLLRALAEVFAALFVAGDDLHTVSAQKLDKRRVAHADAEHCRCFSPQGG